jgi:hypothetical protein
MYLLVSHTTHLLGVEGAWQFHAPYPPTTINICSTKLQSLGHVQQAILQHNLSLAKYLIFALIITATIYNNAITIYFSRLILFSPAGAS